MAGNGLIFEATKFEERDVAKAWEMKMVIEIIGPRMTREQLNAHLTLTAPHGMVAIRGKNHRWYYTKEQQVLSMKKNRVAYPCRPIFGALTDDQKQRMHAARKALHAWRRGYPEITKIWVDETSIIP